MTMPAPTVIMAGPPAFLTLSNIAVSSTPTAFTVTFDSDQAFVANLAYWQGSMPGQGPQLGTVTDASAVLHHVLTVGVGAGHAGQVYSFNLTVDSSDVSGLTLRPYNGVAQIAGARTPTNRWGASVPVRFYMFGGTPPPGAGGSAPPGPGNNGPNIGNWSTYIWAQYNPKGTTYPTP